MLSVNKPLMDNKFSMLTTENTGAVYKAAYNAYYNIAKKALDAASDSVDDPELAAVLDANKTEQENRIKEDSKKFASDFCEGISEMLTEISNQIDAHVKAVADGLMITMLPQGISTVVSPGVGPCTGSMIIQNNATATVIIN